LRLLGFKRVPWASTWPPNSPTHSTASASMGREQRNLADAGHGDPFLVERVTIAIFWVGDKLCLSIRR
jgi:hypothetical protein